MTRAELTEFLREHRLAVQASVRPDGALQAAVVGIAVTDDLELVFDTPATSRTYENLRREPSIAIAWLAVAP